MQDITKTDSWLALKRHHQNIAHCEMADWFDANPDRAANFSLQVAGIHCDYAKNRLTQDTLALLFQLADTCQLRDKIHALMQGAHVNTTENRPALHTLLRNANAPDCPKHLQASAAQIRQCQDRMAHISNQIRTGKWLGWTGKPIQTIIHIGIGGSYLGPALICDALRENAHPELTLHFMANIDGVAFDRITRLCDPETTLLIIASKSFTTQETLHNAKTALTWLDAANAIEHNVIAITENETLARQLGIPAKHCLPMWSWVGGRYSVWSAIGLVFAIQNGFNAFKELLAGAADMDHHFATAPWAKNLPVILALISIWYTNFFHTQTEAVFPYCAALAYFPAYLQQLVMESNGKSMDVTGTPINHSSSPIIWGAQGCQGQHAFYQSLHQGSMMVPADFIVCRTANPNFADHHEMLISNCLSQSLALMAGQKNPDNPHHHIPGNKPNNIIALDSMTPTNLGALLALFEHKTYVQSAIWHINCFDQCGVELGKRLNKSVLAQIRGSSQSVIHPALRHFIKHLRKT